MEREHEAQAFGQGLSFLHIENMPVMQAIIEVALRVTGTLRLGLANAAKVELRRNVVRLARLPAAFDGFTILHLSDLHADLSGPAMRRAAELARDLDYDLCVLTGDFRGARSRRLQTVPRSGRAPARSAARRPLRGARQPRLRSPWFPTSRRSASGFFSTKARCSSAGSASIWLAGVDDAHFFRADNMEKAAADIPQGGVSVLLSHTPEIYRQAAHAGFDLMLSGHTHGGQICLPGGVPILLEANLPRAFAAGAWRHAGMAGYTSVGAGSCVVPVRFNNRPEITLHRLVRGEHE